MTRNDGDDRFERLIVVMEAQANAVGRLVQTLEAKQKRTKRAAASRLQRAVLDKPMVITPIVEAAVKRALARITK